jgi:hypothetical protein
VNEPRLNRHGLLLLNPINQTPRRTFNLQGNSLRAGYAINHAKQEIQHKESHDEQIRKQR